MAKINKRLIAWLSWSVATILYYLQYCLLTYPTAIEKEISQFYGLDDPLLFSLLTSATLFTYMIMQIPVGIMFDRYSVHKLLIVSAISMIIGCAILAFSNNYLIAIFGRMCMGFGGSFTFIGALYICRMGFSSLLFPLLLALTEFMSGFGSISSVALFSVLQAYQGWQMTLIQIGIVLFVLLIIIILYVEDNKNSIKNDSITNSLKFLIKNKLILLLGINSLCMAAHFMVVSYTWGIPYIIKSLHTNEVYASSAISFLFIGFMLGCIIVGLLTRYFSVLKLMLVCAASEMLVSCVILYTDTNLYEDMGLLFIAGLTTGGILLNFNLIKKIVPMEYYGVSTGYINMCFCLSGVVFSPLIGLIAVLSAGNVMLASLPLVLANVMTVIICILLNYKKTLYVQFS